MNIASTFDPAFCELLLTTFAHFLWQGMVIAIVAATANALLRHAGPNWRHALMMTALLVMAVCPWITFRLLTEVEGRTATERTVATPAALEQIARERRSNTAHLDTNEANPDRANTGRPGTGLQQDASSLSPSVVASGDPAQISLQAGSRRMIAPYLMMGYASGVTLLLLRLLVGLHGGWLLSRHSRLVEENVLAVVRRYARALRLRLEPAVAYCDRVAVPTVVGVLRPTILLPVSLVSGLSLDQVEVVIAHELAHIHRLDHLVNVLQRVIEAALFFHPAVWWVSHRIRVEREHCCDDLVVSLGAEPLHYARSLLDVAELGKRRRTPLGLEIATMQATGKSSELGYRIQRLLNAGVEPLRLTGRSVIAIAVMLAALLATTVVFKSDAKAIDAAPLAENEQADDARKSDERTSDSQAETVQPAEGGDIERLQGHWRVTNVSRYNDGKRESQAAITNTTADVARTMLIRDGIMFGIPKHDLPLETNRDNSHSLPSLVGSSTGTLHIDEEKKQLQVKWQLHPGNHQEQVRVYLYRWDGSLLHLAISRQTPDQAPKSWDQGKTMRYVLQPFDKTASYDVIGSLTHEAQKAEDEETREAFRVVIDRLRKIKIEQAKSKPGLILKVVGDDGKTPIPGTILEVHPGGKFKGLENVYRFVADKNGVIHVPRIRFTPERPNDLASLIFTYAGDVRASWFFAANQLDGIAKPEPMTIQLQASRRIFDDAVQWQIALVDFRKPRPKGAYTSYIIEGDLPNIDEPTASKWTGYAQTEGENYRVLKATLPRGLKNAKLILHDRLGATFFQWTERGTPETEVIELGPIEEDRSGMRICCYEPARIVLQLTDPDGKPMDDVKVTGTVRSSVLGERKLSFQSRGKGRYDLGGLFNQEATVIRVFRGDKLQAEFETRAIDRGDTMKIEIDLSKPPPKPKGETDETVRKDALKGYLRERAEMEKVKPGQPLSKLHAGELVFGKPYKGLRAALVLDPLRKEYALGEEIKRKFLVHNVSDKPIQFSTLTWLQASVTGEARDENDKPIKISSALFSGMSPHAHYKLAPGDAVVIEASSLAVGKNDHRVGATLLAQAGQTYRIKFRVAFPGVQISDGQGKVMVPGRGEWIGRLETGEVEFRVVDQ